MVFFKLTNPEEGRWDKVKDYFKEDLKIIEEKFRKVEEDLIAQNFTSADHKRRETAEKNLKELLAMSIYDKDMIAKVQLNHLSDFDLNKDTEIEMVARKLFLAVNAAISTAQDVGGLMWDVAYRQRTIDIPLKEIDKETDEKIRTLKNEEERIKIFAEAEAKKQQIIQNALKARENFAQSFVNQLISAGKAEIEDKIKEAIQKELNTN